MKFGNSKLCRLGFLVNFKFPIQILTVMFVSVNALMVATSLQTHITSILSATGANGGHRIDAITHPAGAQLPT